MFGRQKDRVLTGIRPTGGLHLGHYVGALELWLQLQKARTHECFFLLADIQALTTHAHDPKMCRQSVLDVTRDWLSVGLDPRLSHINFVLQSGVPERAYLAVLLSMIASYNEVVRNPTLKAEMENLRNVSMGFLNYPIDQVADIVMVSGNPANSNRRITVAVGEDQRPHIEFARDLARRFNTSYKPAFVVCDLLVGRVGRLPGFEGATKMSKSQGNAIPLTATPSDVAGYVKRMHASNRARVTDPGQVEGNVVFTYLDAFAADKQMVEDLKRQYRVGGLGDAVLKDLLVRELNAFLEPIRQRRSEIASDDVWDYIKSGTNRARKLCIQTMDNVNDAAYLGIP